MKIQAVFEPSLMGEFSCCALYFGIHRLLTRVVNRIEARKEQIAAAASTVINSAKEGMQTATDTIKGAGYVPRAKHNTPLQTTGLSSAGMVHHKEEDQVLDAASALRLQSVEATNAEIDSSITNLDKSMDRITEIAGLMHEEVSTVSFLVLLNVVFWQVVQQNVKINKIDQKMEKTGDTQALINAKLKYTINKNS